MFSTILNDELQHLMLRRTFDDVEEKCRPPELIQKTRYIKLSHKEKQIYKELERKYCDRYDEIEEETRNKLTISHVLGLVTRLKQAVNHPLLAFSPNDKECIRPLKQRLQGKRVQYSSKLKRIVQDIRVFSQESKVVVFSDYTRMLDLIEHALGVEVINILRIQGDVEELDRVAILNRFKMEPSIRVMLVSLRAGGEGLNIQVASRVILVEPSWNPFVEEQAIARVHRIGQTEPVKVTRYIVSGTIEDRILALQNSKFIEFEKVIEGRILEKTGLTIQQIRFLLKGIR
jgi:SNF2 family DNA or RNA helicase